MTTRVFSVEILLIGPLLGCGLFAKGQTQGCPNSVPTSTPKGVFKDTIEKVKGARTVPGKTTDTKEVQEQTRVQNAGAAVLENMVPFLLCFGQEGLASVIEAERIDKQVGSSSSSSGTTSLTSNGSVPDLLGLAVENGALTQSVSGTTVTFRGNPAGIIEALAKKDYFKIPAQHDEGDPNIRILRNISFALTFDISRGSTPNVFTGSGQQLASYSFRYDILNRRDPRD